MVSSEVYKARTKRTGSIVALKKILMHHEKDGVSLTPPECFDMRECRLTTSSSLSPLSARSSFSSPYPTRIFFDFKKWQ